MPIVQVNDQPFVYETEGDGFPLFLVSAPFGAISLWHPLMSLLGELCKAIVYEYTPQEAVGPASERFQSARLAHDFLTLLDTFNVERAYLAATASAVPMILDIIQQASTRLEALIIVGKAEDDALTSHPTWQLSTVPTLLLVGAQDLDHRQWAAQQATHLPHVRRGVVPEAGRMPLHEQPQRLGHTMMSFLLHCERQRNLVRGASFLL